MAEIRARRGLWNRAVVSAVVVAALTIAAFAGANMLYRGTDRPTPDRDINTYALFAWESLNLKGKLQTTVQGGNIGVNNRGGELTMCVNGQLRMGQGTQVVADIINVGRDCHLWDIFWGTGRFNPAGLDDWHGSGTFSPPINPTNVPAIPANATCNASKPVTGGAGAASPLPGVYGDLTLMNDEVQKLQSGSYTFCNVKMGKDAWLDLKPDTKVTVIGSFAMSNASFLGHRNGAPIAGGDPGGIGDTAFAPFLVLGRNSNGLTVNFSKHTTVRASFFAPNGTMGLGNDTSLYGRFWAKRIISDANTRVIVPPGGSTPTTTTTKPTSTTTTKPTSTTTTTKPTSTTTSSTTTTTKPTSSTTSSTSTTTTTKPNPTTTSSSSTTSTTDDPGES